MATSRVALLETSRGNDHHRHLLRHDNRMRVSNGLYRNEAETPSGLGPGVSAWPADFEEKLRSPTSDPSSSLDFRVCTRSFDYPMAGRWVDGLRRYSSSPVVLACNHTLE